LRIFLVVAWVVGRVVDRCVAGREVGMVSGASAGREAGFATIGGQRSKRAAMAMQHGTPIIRENADRLAGCLFRSIPVSMKSPFHMWENVPLLVFAA